MPIRTSGAGCSRCPETSGHREAGLAQRSRRGDQRQADQGGGVARIDGLEQADPQALALEAAAGAVQRRLGEHTALDLGRGQAAEMRRGMVAGQGGSRSGWPAQTAVWKCTERPDIADNCATAASKVPGLPRGRPSSWRPGPSRVPRRPRGSVPGPQPRPTAAPRDAEASARPGVSSTCGRACSKGRPRRGQQLAAIGGSRGEDQARHRRFSFRRPASPGAWAGSEQDGLRRC